MRGCNEGRPYRNWGEQGFQLQRPSAESAKTRGASESEPAALKVQLCEVEAELVIIDREIDLKPVSLFVSEDLSTRWSFGLFR